MERRRDEVLGAHPLRERRADDSAAAVPLLARGCASASTRPTPRRVVYYGRYFPYFDRARVEYLRHLGLLHSLAGRASSS